MAITRTRHGKYKTSTGKVHRFSGKRDWLECLVYDCGLRLPIPSDEDKLTRNMVTCKRCQASKR